jgi:hypothetical protein
MGGFWVGQDSDWIWLCDGRESGLGQYLGLAKRIVRLNTDVIIRKKMCGLCNMRLIV